jgi:branched-chain amino acid transport system permease protein
LTPTAQKWGPAAILVIAVVLLTLGAQFRPSIYSTSVTIGIYALIALPLGLIYGQGGTISLAQGAFAALGGYCTAILSTRYGLSPFATLVPSVLFPALVAFLVARPILRLPELSLALVTLSFGTIVEILLERGGDFTGGYVGLSGVPPLPLAGSQPFAAHLGIWAIVLLAVILYSRFRTTSRGRALRAIRVDRLLAEGMGVNVAFDLSVLFALSAGVAGLAGWYYSHFIGFIAPDSLNVALSANVLFMVVVGGRKLVLGPVLGAAVFVWASDLLPGTEMQGMLFGFMLVVILMFCPDGLLSLLPGSRRRMGQKPAGSERTVSLAKATESAG